MTSEQNKSMMRKVRAAIYTRVSDGGRQTTMNQRPDLERLAAARGYEIVHVFDEAGSAAKARPGYDAMLDAAHAGKFSVLLVWSLDRFGRSMTGNLNAVLELDRIGVQVVSVMEPWLDTGSPVRSLLIAIFSWVAEQERLRLIDRTKAGLERARRQGKLIGRPRVHVDVERAQALRAQGKSVEHVAKLLGVGVGTLHRALQNARLPEPPPPAAC